MNILYIDGEYAKKIIPDCETLESIIEKYFGILFYPQKIIYYTANISNEKRKKLESIKNLEVNSRGYINKIGQKGVDGFIVSDMTDASWNSEIQHVTLIAGDGDLAAGLEKVYERKNKKANVISSRNSTSDSFQNSANIFYIEDIINIEKLEKIIDTAFEVDKNIFLEMYQKIESKYKIVTDALIGQNAKKYKLDYKKYGPLKKFINLLVEHKVIKKEKVHKNGPHYELILL